MHRKKKVTLNNIVKQSQISSLNTALCVEVRGDATVKYLSMFMFWFGLWSILKILKLSFNIIDTS